MTLSSLEGQAGYHFFFKNIEHNTYKIWCTYSICFNSLSICNTASSTAYKFYDVFCETHHNIGLKSRKQIIYGTKYIHYLIFLGKLWGVSLWEFWRKLATLNKTKLSMALHTTVVTPLLMHWIYCSLSQSNQYHLHGYNIQFGIQIMTTNNYILWWCIHSHDSKC